MGKDLYERQGARWQNYGLGAVLLGALIIAFAPELSDAIDGKSSSENSILAIGAFIAGFVGIGSIVAGHNWAKMPTRHPYTDQLR